jgi:hypothetical protein
LPQRQKKTLATPLRLQVVALLHIYTLGLSLKLTKRRTGLALVGASISESKKIFHFPRGLGDMNAIETTGIVDEQRQLRLDRPLPITGPSRVRILILVPEPGDLEEEAWLKAAATNPAFDFLKEETEDIYRQTDGKPFHDQG